MKIVDLAEIALSKPPTDMVTGAPLSLESTDHQSVIKILMGHRTFNEHDKKKLLSNVTY